jgi:hypothetical protein
MAIHDHTGRIRPSFPLIGTPTPCSAGSWPAGRVVRDRRRRRPPTAAIGNAAIPLIRSKA